MGTVCTDGACPACPACLPACLPAGLPAFLHACTLACMHDHSSEGWFSKQAPRNCRAVPRRACVAWRDSAHSPLLQAYAKALGLGLAAPLASATFAVSSDERHATLTVDGAAQPDWRFSLHRLPRSHWVATARAKPSVIVDAFGVRCLGEGETTGEGRVAWGMWVLDPGADGPRPPLNGPHSWRIDEHPDRPAAMASIRSPDAWCKQPPTAPAATLPACAMQEFTRTLQKQAFTPAEWAGVLGTPEPAFALLPISSLLPPALHDAYEAAGGDVL